jgi:hypothetical protein
MSARTGGAARPHGASARVSKPQSGEPPSRLHGPHSVRRSLGRHVEVPRARCRTWMALSLRKAVSLKP